ncbi:Tetraacyldisaccharide 4'-kinase [Acidisarcina polymorpha]|uniref:Tetraacyldisaccharide 4'-kinase n=1 Tax=Acidisarcina polymorpha TaxID=2211140 RepID=A0A2Z5G9U6_9BACT|nr:tetraacyldisaccharide 4'-kinase [Acidisarcina polymorpha]AXC15346.1 Tetraacyldisaccharide 4'-kinase [Acidisarcina polymorpha]
MAPLAPVYGAAVAAKNEAYQRRWLKAHRLRWPVISVGNLSVGGSGKTPLTIRLAELLSAEHVVVDVLSRGYGRRSSKAQQVDPTGDAGRFGDEPLLIARRTGCPVFVGASRYEAGLIAESDAAREDQSSERHKRPHLEQNDSDREGAVRFVAGDHLHLLDDGFQHRQLARNVDIVVLHRSDFAERLLPAGRLREPLGALQRAHFVVLREEDAAFEAELRRLGIAAPVWLMQRSLALPKNMAGSLQRVVAFCGIARPEEFFSSLNALDVNLELTITFPDHHDYQGEDMAEIARVAKQVRAEAFVITEKDAVKLNRAMLAVLEEIAPVHVAALKLELRDETAVTRQLAASIDLSLESRLPPESGAGRMRK